MGNALHTPGAPGVGLVSPAEARLDDAGLLAVGATGLLSARTGVLAGPGSAALVTGTSSTAPMRYSVAAHHWVTSRGAASDGVYRGAAEAVKTVDTTAAPGSGSRIDVVWVKQLDQYSTLTPDASSAPQYGCTQGTPTTGTPAKPTIPVGAEELAVAVVSAGQTRTDTGVAITQTARQTVARGAPVPVRNQAERDALATYPLLMVARLDTGVLEVRNAADTAWGPLAPGVQPALRWTAAQPGGSVPANTVWGVGPITSAAQRGGTFGVGTDTITVPSDGLWGLTWLLGLDTTFSPRSFQQAIVGGVTYRQPMGGPAEATSTLNVVVPATAGQSLQLQLFSNHSTGPAGATSRGTLVRVGDLL